MPLVSSLLAPVMAHCLSLYGQLATTPSQLPDAPLLSRAALTQKSPAPFPQTGGAASSMPSDRFAAQHPRLTRTEAEQMAIKNNPRVSVAHLLALAQHQVVREIRSGELPTATADITTEDAKSGSRISAGSLTASRLIEHAGAGGGFTQLITDFGKTRNLVAYAKLQEKAQNANLLATTEDIVLAADQAFFSALQARALLSVANDDVRARQVTATQVSELTKNKLRSTLDLSFANVNLSQAKLLQLDAQNNVDSTMAALDAVLGLDRQVAYDLVDDTAPLSAPSADLDELVNSAIRQRPDLQSLNLNQQAALSYSRAQRDQMLPTIAAAGTAGAVPVRPGEFYTTSWWGGIGINMSIPIFNGFLYSAQAKEASIRAQAASEQSRDLRDRIVRDVRTAWLASTTAYQRVTVTAELLQQANLALQLAQARYKLGLSSIVELSQAEFQQTDAAIGNTDAQYQYRLALATLNYETGATP
jgi:outer membrane protein